MKKTEKPEGKPEGVLYRKHRPKGWGEVVGQEHVVRVLEGEAKTGKIAHAYLFSGPRGTGKTSVARIFASAIGTSGNDLYELDAASNRGIDDIREIRDSVPTMPFDSKYKVYILDEAHMLTKEAWNALLKTLEEPPAHAVFILATTELEKVPETVVSRSQTFSFKRPTQAVLRDFAVEVAKKEGRALDKDAAELVSLLGDGSYRDTHGILEKVLASSVSEASGTGTKAETTTPITRVDVEAVTGSPKAELVKDVLTAVVLKDLSLGLSAVREAVKANADMKLFSRLVLERMRFLFLLRLKAGAEAAIKAEVSEDDFAFLSDLASKADATLTSETLSRFVTAYEDAGKTAIAELPLELALADTIVDNLN